MTERDEQSQNDMVFAVIFVLAVVGFLITAIDAILSAK